MCAKPAFGYQWCSYGSPIGQVGELYLVIGPVLLKFDPDILGFVLDPETGHESRLHLYLLDHFLENTGSFGGIKTETSESIDRMAFIEHDLLGGRRCAQHSALFQSPTVGQ